MPNYPPFLRDWTDDDIRESRVYVEVFADGKKHLSLDKLGVASQHWNLTGVALEAQMRNVIRTRGGQGAR